VLSEAYSHDPFLRRIAVTYDFVAELLSFVAANADDIVDLSREAATRTTGWGNDPATARQIPIRSTIESKYSGPVRVEDVVRTGDTVRYEAGLPLGVRRTGGVRTIEMPVYDRFAPSLSVAFPFAYAFPRDVGDSLVKRLVMHGVLVDQLDRPLETPVTTFTIDSTSVAAQPFQKHRERRLFGTWGASTPRTLPEGTYLVRTGQPLGILAIYLLEPLSDDGFVDWNVLDAWANEHTYPVVRIVHPVRAQLHPVTN